MGFSIPTPGGGDGGGSGSGFPLTGDTDVGGFDLENVGEGDAPGEAVTLGQLDERGAILNASDGSPATAYISADDTDDPADLPDFPGDGAWWLNLADLGSPDAANVTFDDSGLIVITGVGDVAAAIAAADAALAARITTAAANAAYAPLRTWDAATDNDDGTTTSTSFTDLTGSSVGPAVTITVPASGAVRLTFSAEIENSSSSPLHRTYAGWAASGANTIAAAFATAAMARNSQSDPIVSGRSLILEGLTPGVTTFTMKYAVGGGTGTVANRHINVETLP